MTNINTIKNEQVGYSQIPDNQIIDFESTFGAHHYGRLGLVVRKAEGAWLHGIDGKKHLDCLAAYSAANQGHHHPKIVGAVMDALQGKYGSVISNVVYTDSLGLFLKKVANLVPQLGPRFGDNGNKVLPKNGGVESVETAVKMARYYGWKEKGIEDGKQEVIVFTRNFHGRMITTISFSPTPKYKEGFGPLTPGFKMVPFGDLEATKKAITPNTCGILVEPMQGVVGVDEDPSCAAQDSFSVRAKIAPDLESVHPDHIRTTPNRNSRVCARRSNEIVDELRMRGRSPMAACNVREPVAACCC